jgi:DNA-binding NarL/FixJ family response regulator
MRLLICDDHKALVDALSMALSQLGHTVVATALDPDEAVAAAREHQPDVCLLDLSFPHDNGLSAIARIRGVSADTNVVMLSGSISTDLVADAIAQGAHGFVSKEKSIGVIAEALEQAHHGHLAVDPIFMPDVPQPHPRKVDPLSGGLSLVQIHAPLHVSPSTVDTIHASTRRRKGTDWNQPGDRKSSTPERRTRWHHLGAGRRGGRDLRSLTQPRNVSCTTPIHEPIRITVPNIDSAGSWEIALATMC